MLARPPRGSTSASISVIDAHSSQIVFAYAVGQAGNTNQIQSTAEACAKQPERSHREVEEMIRWLCHRCGFNASVAQRSHNDFMASVYVHRSFVTVNGVNFYQRRFMIELSFALYLVHPFSGAQEGRHSCDRWRLRFYSSAAFRLSQRTSRES
jgi:hypothetical protein